MILVLQESPRGPVYIEHVATVGRAETRARVIRAHNYSPMREAIIPGDAKTVELVYKALRKYRKGDTRWFRAKKARPVLTFAKRAQDELGFSARRWAKEQLQKTAEPDLLDKMRKGYDPTPHIGEWERAQRHAEFEAEEERLDREAGT